jgi:mannose/cellobiose epimerase-like protein (N-acyl-D-glucosamine 2-epimerase family)
MSSGTGLLAAGLACEKKPIEKEILQSEEEIGTIEGMTLEQLRDFYRSELFDNFLPAMDKMVIDQKYGGFMCNAKADGTHIDTNKRTWYEGRGIWVYSFLYNNIEPDRKYLDIASKSVEFILKVKPSDDTFWNIWYTREGKPIGGPDPVIESDNFVALGLQEYSKAVKDEQFWNMAKEIVLKYMHVYDTQPNYGAIPPGEYLPGGSQGGYDPGVFGSNDKNVNRPGVPRTRILGNWMLTLRVLSQMIEKKPDPELEALAARCQDAIMNYHWNPDFQLFNEYLNYDMSRINNDHGQVVYGHGQEAMWMMMERALQKKDKQLFDTSAERLKRQIEVFWDDVYGGELLELLHVDKNIWNVTKAIWLHDEILIGTMMIIEHTVAQWAKYWFKQILDYIKNKFDYRKYGYPLWGVYMDRKCTFDPNYARICNFHQPCQIMLNLLAVERILKRGGKVSNLFM